MIIVASTFAQVFSRSDLAMNIIGVLIVWRFVMGVGVGMGGDHSLSAVIASEFASTGNRGHLLTTVFTAQSWGNLGTLYRSCVAAAASVAQLVLAASLVELVTINAYKDSIIADNFSELRHVDYCWRTLICLGSIPGAIALYLRLTIPATFRFKMDIDRDIQRARTDVDNVLGYNGTRAAGVHHRRSHSDFTNYFAQRSDFLLLFGVAYSWFAIDASSISFTGRRTN